MSKESALSALTGSPAPAVEAQLQQAENNTPTESPPAAQPKQEPQSGPFNHLAKKEAELVRQRAEIKKEQEKLEADRKVLLDAKAKYDEYEEKRKTDPVAALKMLGYSETDIINYLANQQPVELTPEEKAAKVAAEAAESKIKAFEEAQAKKEKEAQAAQDKQLIQNYRSEMGKVIEADKEKYEFCSYYGEEAQELAYEIALAVVAESGGTEIITASEAVRRAEEYYEEKDRQMNSLKKRQPKPTTDPVEPETKAQPERTRTVTPANPNAEQPKPPITRVRTLSNVAASTVASTRLARNESREEKRARLIEALKNGNRP